MTASVKKVMLDLNAPSAVVAFEGDMLDLTTVVLDGDPRSVRSIAPSPISCTAGNPNAWVSSKIATNFACALGAETRQSPKPQSKSDKPFASSCLFRLFDFAQSS